MWGLARHVYSVWWLLSVHALAGLVLLFTGPRSRFLGSAGIAVIACGLLGWLRSRRAPARIP
jgi:hypothetical protein